MKHLVITLSLFLICIPAWLQAQVKTVSSDTDWAKQQVALKDAHEAEFIIRLGDVDNLGFGWPDGFDPFCGRMTEAHYYPWDVNPNDLPGFDRILLSSKYNPDKDQPCGADGYVFSYNPQTGKPVTWSIPTELVKGAAVNDAWLQLFIDDFQAPTFCSRYQVLLNGARYTEAERVINAIDQTGPVGKLISIRIPEDYHAAIAEGKALTLAIDEVTGAADGFALDFIRLLVNRKRQNTCKGNIAGTVIDKETGMPIAKAKVWSAYNTPVTTNGEGSFELKDIPTGFEAIIASAPGFADGSAMADIGEGSDNPHVLVYLEKGKAEVQFDNRKVKVGETIALNNIMFDVAKADLKPESKTELDKVVAFLKANPGAEIELSGHTSAEGDAAYNRSLSYKRVKACKDYIVNAGIDSGRIIAVGYGPDRPIAPNDTETNRAKNRRVEMRFIKL